MSSDMIEDTDFDAEMEKMAVHLLSEAQKSNVKLEEKVKVFEAIQPYHAAREKYKGKQPGIRPNGNRTFSQFKESVREAKQ